MTGVEILAVEEVVIATVFSWSVFWIAFAAGAFVIGGISFLIFSAESHGDDSMFNINGAIIVGILCGILVGMIFGGGICPDLTEYGTQYKVTIDDSVSMNEFNEKYEIIDQEGKIYTVKERQNKND